MAVNVSEVRSETQIPASFVSDADILYVIQKSGTSDLYAVCAYVLRLVCRKYRGRTRIRVGDIWEDINISEMRRLAAEFESLSTTKLAVDGVTEPDPFFTREGL